MRMWMVDPRLLCRQHLLGEHVEVHMLCGCLRRRINIAGFITGGLVEPQSVERRHRALAEELRRRGYRHRSPLPRSLPSARHVGRVDAARSLRELARRCAACRKLQREGCVP